jgi:hypothetical protein
LVCPSPYPYQGEEWIVGVFVFYPSAAVAEKPDSGDEQFAASVDVFCRFTKNCDGISILIMPNYVLNLGEKK